jgi:hypothetical protein
MRFRLPRSQAPLARSYGPLATVAVAFVIMAIAVDPLPRDRETFAGNVSVPTIQTGNGPVVTNPDGTQGKSGQAGTSGQQGAQNPSGNQGGVQPCTDRVRQVAAPYSPPCYAFSGENGGATSRGVTPSEIIISARELEGPSAAEIFADISGENVSDSPEAVEDTIRAINEYFNKHFQLYGRKIKLVQFKGQGNGASELLGGGKEKAQSDAVQAANEIKAFADISGFTIPYADALARKGVINIGAPYPSRKWFVEHRPYAWSLFPDGTNVVEAHSSWVISRLTGQNTAEYAGDGIKGKPRKYAVVAPENAEYQESVNSYIGILAKAGIKVSLNVKYKLDISSMPNQASGIIAQLKDAGVTSVLCGCDPVMLALGLTPKSNEQDYNPEWLTAGLAFVEQDIVGQLIDEKQWAHAFGIAYNAESEVFGKSAGYFAYKEMRPNGEPAFGVEAVYYQFLMLAIGLQMAGPNLTPQTFEAGMFAYPGGTGPQGTWHFGPGDYTPMDDFREIWWSNERISPQNNKPGTWVQLNGGRRYFAGQVPKGRAPYFEQG